LAEYGVNYNHGGSAARLFHAYTYPAGPISGISAGGRVRQAKGNCVISVAGRRAFANSSTVPIAGFEPNRNEMVFERASLSCYPGEPFTVPINQSPGGIALAGFAGGSACLTTLIGAFHRHRRNHEVTYLSDASASPRTRRDVGG
jgi:hypothetical protein